MMTIRHNQSFMRIIAFTLLFAMLTCLFPAGRQEAAAETKNLQNPRITEDGTVTWDCVWFGHYPQSSDGKGGFNNEPIKWRILSVDENEALLVADKNLDAKKYNEERIPITWETSTLRSWLNNNDLNGFMGKAFSKIEQEAICEKAIQNPDNSESGTPGGNITKDKLFLLSVEEARNVEYGFPDNLGYSETRESMNTDYAASGDEYVYKNSKGIWWLRSPGGGEDGRGVWRASFIRQSGSVGYDYINKYGGTVRPALYLDLSSDIWSYAGTVSSDGTAKVQDEENRGILSYNGHKYQIFANSGLSWTEAKKQCELLGGHLVTISSQGEMDTVISMLGPNSLNAYWIGLSRKDVNADWQWVTGEKVEYTNWVYGEPNNAYNLGENYAHLYANQYRGNQIGQWNDMLHNGGDGYYEEYYNLSNFGFICEWESADDVKAPRFPIMTENEAKAFWGFLFNIPQDFRTKEFFENDLSQDIIFKLLTGKYAPYSQDEEVARNVFASMVDSQLTRLTNESAKNTEYLRGTLLDCLEKELGSEPDATEMKGECQKIFDKIRKPFQEKLEDTLIGAAAKACGKQLTQNNLDNLKFSMSVGTDIAALPGKIEEFVNRTVMGVSGVLLTVNSELAGRYQYFSAYLDHRGAVSDPDSLEFQIRKETVKCLSGDGNVEGIFTTFIPGKKSWMECADIIENWAEKTYLILNTSLDEQPTEPTKPSTETEPTNPTVIPSDPSTDPTESPTEPVKPTTSPVDPAEPAKPPTTPVKPTVSPTSPATPSTELTKPSVEPGKPTAKPTNPAPNTKPTSPGKLPAKGKAITDAKSKAVYTITKTGKTGGTVTYAKPTGENVTSVTIPSTITIGGITYKVTAIAPNAFKNCKRLQKVTIGGNIQTIGKAAFSGCSKLKTVNLGNNVTTIDNQAFYKCTALTKVIIPAKVAKIGKKAFCGCKKLKNITIKTKKLTSKRVGASAFKGIQDKATVKAPKGKAKAYKKLLQAKGLSKKAQIK